MSATESTPLQSTAATPTTSAYDEYGYDYVDDDDAMSDESNDALQRRQLHTMSGFFSESDHTLSSEQQQRKQRVATVVAFVLLALLVLFFVWSSLRSAAQPPPSALPQGSGAVVHMNASSAFFCGLSNFETGYVRLPNKQDDHYFYWFVTSTSAEPSNDPLVLWLTGGPGAPSTLALLTENGPCIVQPDLSTKLNEYSWTNNANVIWLDQPTNVGFSFGAPEDADSTEDNVGKNIYYFLKGFFDKHPELAGRDFYITGESYGGHYVPAAAHYIWQQNKLETTRKPIINLQGIAIGNGLVNTALQEMHFTDMVDNAYNITFTDTATLASMCAAALDCEHQRPNQGATPDADDTCFDALRTLMNDAKRDPYDIRRQCNEDDASRCVPSDHVRAYLERPLVRERLGVSDRANTWQMVNMDVNMAFAISGDEATSTAPLVADLLNSGDVRVLVYAGDADLACNWYGNDAWTKALEWNGKTQFNAATERSYVTASGVDAGTVRSFDGRFAFVRVFNAGHMVPQDQPAVALDLLDRLVHNHSFV